MKSSTKKFFLLLASTTLLVGCNKALSNSNTSEQSKQPESSNSTVSSVSNSTNPSQSNPPVSSISSSQAPASSVNHNPNECNNHVLKETVVKEATLIEKGIKHYHCDNCGADFHVCQ